MAIMRAVLVEDEDAIVRPLVAAFHRDGFEVERFVTAEEALEALPTLDPAVVILDVSLPGMTGFEACRIIRERSSVPLVMLTARGEVEDRVLGLELGADDYVPKPFSSRELISRIRAVLRRRGWEQERPQVLVAGALEVDPDRRRARVEGRDVHLTPREFDLLAHLAARTPRVVSRRELIREVWDPLWTGPTQTLDVHVAQLRRKIEPDPRRPRFIHTVRGLGYQVHDACAGG